MQALNAAQVRELFEREAILLGSEDMVPDFRAVSLFGKEAVKHAHRRNAENPGYFANGYGVGDYTMTALTFRGFRAAASFFNVQTLRNEAESSEV